SRHAACEDRAHVSDSDVENISSSNRPSILEMKYQDFYDHDRMDAIYIIEKSRIRTRNNQFNQIEDSRIACLIFEEAYRAALIQEVILSSACPSILMAAPSIGAEWFQRSKNRDPKERNFAVNIEIHGSKTSSLDHGVVNHLQVIMKETSDICDVGVLVKRIEDKLRHDWDKQNIFQDYNHDLLSQPGIKKYMIECSKYAWKLVCQTHRTA
ncbi:hypothetical protein OS493_030156, partial [Desmophyllum pertusum]